MVEEMKEQEMRKRTNLAKFVAVSGIFLGGFLLGRYIMGDPSVLFGGHWPLAVMALLCFIAGVICLWEDKL